MLVIAKSAKTKENKYITDFEETIMVQKIKQKMTKIVILLKKSKIKK